MRTNTRMTTLLASFTGLVLLGCGPVGTSSGLPYQLPPQDEVPDNDPRTNDDEGDEDPDKGPKARDPEPPIKVVDPDPNETRTATGDALVEACDSAMSGSADELACTQSAGKLGNEAVGVVEACDDMLSTDDNELTRNFGITQ